MIDGAAGPMTSPPAATTGRAALASTDTDPPIREQPMPSLHRFPRPARILAAALCAMLSAGCARPLAVQDAYFAPTNGTVSAASERIRHTVSHHRALQVARRGCASPTRGSVPEGEAAFAHGPDFGSAAAREALARLCATPIRPPVAAHGGASNAYRRWVEDRVRELPEAAQTAAGAAGGGS